MYTNHYGTEEYPHEGYFYEIGIDNSKPLDERVEEEIVIFETTFDLAEGQNLSMDSFRIFFPFDFEEDEIVISEGDTFRGSIWGANVNGRVVGIYPSQLGGCTVLLKRI